METEMKLHLNLSREERRTLHEMGIYHPHARTRMRAQGMYRLAQGLTLQHHRCVACSGTGPAQQARRGGDGQGKRDADHLEGS
jgi:hypothetical protein